MSLSLSLYSICNEERLEKLEVDLCNTILTSQFEKKRDLSRWKQIFATSMSLWQISSAFFSFVRVVLIDISDYFTMINNWQVFIEKISFVVSNGQEQPMLTSSFEQGQDFVTLLYCNILTLLHCIELCARSRLCYKNTQPPSPLVTVSYQKLLQ